MDIAEIEIQSDQYAIFGLSSTRDDCVVCSGEALIEYGIGFEACVAEENRTVGGQVLVDLKFQTVCSKGRSAVPSRASSAA